MKQFVSVIILCILFGCANNASKEMDTTNILEANGIKKEEEIISKEDAYALLIKEKLQEQIDKKNLTKNHPNFDIDLDDNKSFFNKLASGVKSVKLIEPIETISDSVKSIKTEVVFGTEIDSMISDTIVARIKTSTIEIDGESLNATQISFDKIKVSKNKTINQPKASNPKSVNKFSLKDLSFTWEEINACDCLFMVKATNTDYKKLYFGRFKGDSTGIIQLGKNTEKFHIPLIQSRSKNRKPGTTWKETYKNNQYRVRLKATPTIPKVKGKYTYYIDFRFTDLSSKKVITKRLLTNCRL
ncbi:hypothetical protein [Aquimarina sp. MMG016]|uniref:hypothetical protein n=1 Tax=Aquimarina sp. MMG016 TaxID=2822690 RepID=UPI001B3A3002|nr:hypothetical protein [Aquimarina sp. MMG016]MBQ4821536.1 hypothetical protein [Aquimarina sp. MMG016]